MISEEIKDWFNRFYKEAKELYPQYEKDNTKLFPRMVLKTMSELDLSDEDIEIALDNLGSGDFGIDAFLRDSNNNFHIFQFKSKKDLSENKTLPIKNIQNEIDSFISTIDKLKQDHCVKNKRVTDIKEQLMDYPDAEFNFYYYTQELLEQFKIDEYEKFYELKNLKILDLQIGLDKYADYITSFSEELESLNINIEESINIINQQKKSSVLIINGYEICKLMKDKKFQLFKNNVRFYLGDKQPVNKKIIETAKENPENFFNFNNGITIEATDSATINKNLISLKKPSIINGAQTVNCIYSAYKKMIRENNNDENPNYDKNKILKEHFEKIKLLVKLSIINNNKDEYSKILSKNVNSQNIIKEADYFSNLQEQIFLKRELGITYNLFYEIKRGETTYFRTRPGEIENITQKQFKTFNKNYLKLQDFTRSYIAVFDNPSSSYHSLNSLFKKENNLYQSLIEKELKRKMDFMLRKMLFANYLTEIVKDELNLYKKFYNSLHDTGKSEEEKIRLLNNTGFPYKNELIENINNLDGFENAYGSLNILLLNKGKYIYSYFIRFLIDNIKNKKNGKEYFERFIDEELLKDYNKFRKTIVPLIYYINEILDPHFSELIKKGKSENQLTMESRNYLNECEIIIKNKIIEFNRFKIIDRYIII